MGSQLKWKFVFIAIVVIASLYSIVGMPQFPTSVAKLKQNLSDRINLGLDLRGGSHLVLQVQVDEAIGQRCANAGVVLVIARALDLDGFSVERKSFVWIKDSGAHAEVDLLGVDSFAG